MVDAVNTLQNSTPAPVRSVVPDAPVRQDVAAESRPVRDFTTSNIRVDANLDLAILEFRSSQTGEVERQYPTERQIASIQRAAQLEAIREQREGPSTQSVPGSSIAEAIGNGPDRAQASAPPPPQVTQANAPVSGATGVDTTSGTTATLSDTSSVSTSTQSVTV